MFGFDGVLLICDCYWWLVIEVIGVLVSLIKVNGGIVEDVQWYVWLWVFVDVIFIDDVVGGWMLEINVDNQLVQNQFVGKFDIYYVFQVDLLLLISGVLGYYEMLFGIGL